MKRKRHTPEEIIKKLRETATLLAGGQGIEEVCKKLEVSPPTYHRWRQEYGGAKEETVKRLKELEKENAQLKKLVADLSLDKAMLKELVEGNEVSRSLFSSENKRQSGRPGAQTRGGGAHLEEVLEVSQHRACEVVVQPRSTQRYHGRRHGRDAALAAELRRIVPRHQRKRQRLGSSEGGTQRLRAERVNQVWSYDFIFDQTEDGRRLKWLPICDEFSRELVALEVERRMDAKDVIRILEEAVLARGCVPEFIRSDNGPEFIALAVQDWIARRGFKTLDIKPGAPRQNAYSESFHSRFRDEFLNRELFGGLTEAKVLGQQHRHWHNQERPHSSLDDQTPVEFAQRPYGCALPPEHPTHNQTPETNQKLS